MPASNGKKQGIDPTAEEAAKLLMFWVCAVLMGWAGYAIAASQVGWVSLSFWFFFGLGVLAVGLTLLYSMLKKL